MPVTVFFLKMAATLINVAITSMQNNYMFLFVNSMNVILGLCHNYSGKVVAFQETNTFSTSYWLSLQSCIHMKHHMPSL